jgi:hypothetical protein
MRTKMNKSKIIHILLLSTIIYSCTKDTVEPTPVTNEVIESFISETGLVAVYVLDTSLLNTVISWQGQGDYPGVDDWATAKVPNNFELYGGLPGQSEYYTINQTLTDADTMQVVYWESLQVKPSDSFGYRPWVGIFDIKKDTIVVAIAKTLANPQYGEGGAWQLYVENYNEVLTITDTVSLIGNIKFKMTSKEYEYWENARK